MKRLINIFILTASMIYAQEGPSVASKQFDGEEKRNNKKRRGNKDQRFNNKRRELIDRRFTGITTINNDHIKISDTRIK